MAGKKTRAAACLEGARLLKEYLDGQGDGRPPMSQAAFGHAAGLDRITVLRALRADRRRNMSVNVAAAIEDATGGVVPMRAWVSKRRRARRQRAEGVAA